MRLTTKDVDRFVAKVILAGDNDCWLWNGAKHSRNRGYGKFRIRGKVLNAHRASYLLFKGSVPTGLEVSHLCGNESCVNPRHLIAESHSANVQRIYDGYAI